MEHNPTRPVSGTRVVALIGPAQAGKTTVATRLVQAYQHSRFRFADSLKKMVHTMGVSWEQIDGADKELPLDILDGRSSRHAMQTLGTQWGRELIGYNLWAKQCAHAIDQSDAVLVVVDDGRFPNETAIMKERFNTTIIRVWNSNKKYPYIKMWFARRKWGRVVAKIIPFLYIHESEAWWPVLPADVTIDNNGSLDDLYLKIHEAMHGSPVTAAKTRLKIKGTKQNA